MVTGVEPETVLVVTVNEAVVAPAATVTLPGTCADVLLLLRATVAPPAGAALLRVTVATEEFPPTTLTGLGVRESRVTGPAVTTRLAIFVVPYTAEIETVMSADTDLVVTLKVTDVAFAATVATAGTCATAVLLLERVTTTPPVGAGLLSFSVPVADRPPGTVVGLRLTDATVTAGPPVV